MPVKLNSTGGGSVTLDVGSTASNFNLTLPSANATVLSSAAQSIPKAALPTGSILQAVVTQVTSVVTVSNPVTFTFYDIPGFTVTITPTSASSRILILSMISVASSTLSGGDRTYLRLLRDSTPIGIGDQVSNLQRVNAEFWNNDGTNVVNQNIQWLDSPATTSAVTYKFQCSTNAGGATSVFNRSRDSNLQQHQTQSTQILALEIAS